MRRLSWVRTLHVLPESARLCQGVPGTTSYEERPGGGGGRLRVRSLWNLGTEANTTRDALNTDAPPLHSATPLSSHASRRSSSSFLRCFTPYQPQKCPLLVTSSSNATLQTRWAVFLFHLLSATFRSAGLMKALQAGDTDRTRRELMAMSGGCCLYTTYICI